MKKFYMFAVSVVIIAAFSAVSLMANPEIMKKHAGKTKDGKNVNCGYCHTGAKIAKKGGQDRKALAKMPACLGAGCHK